MVPILRILVYNIGRQVENLGKFSFFLLSIVFKHTDNWGIEVTDPYQAYSLSGKHPYYKVPDGKHSEGQFWRIRLVTLSRCFTLTSKYDTNIYF